MLKCVMVLGSVFLTDEGGHTLINAHHVTEFEAYACGWQEQGCLDAEDGQGYQIARWTLPQDWAGLGTHEVLARCEASATSSLPE